MQMTYCVLLFRFARSLIVLMISTIQIVSLIDYCLLHLMNIPVYLISAVC